MKLLALGAAQKQVWNIYCRLAQSNIQGAQALGGDAEWLFAVHWYNTLPEHTQKDIPPDFNVVHTDCEINTDRMISESDRWFKNKSRGWE